MFALIAGYITMAIIVQWSTHVGQCGLGVGFLWSGPSEEKLVSGGGLCVVEATWRALTTIGYCVYLYPVTLVTE